MEFAPPLLNEIAVSSTFVKSRFWGGRSDRFAHLFFHGSAGKFFVQAASFKRATASFGSKSVLLALMLQAIRAFLLAKATVALLKPCL